MPLQKHDIFAGGGTGWRKIVEYILLAKLAWPMLVPPFDAWGGAFCPVRDRDEQPPIKVLVPSSVTKNKQPFMFMTCLLNGMRLGETKQT
jgi:hypothetical protein